MMDMSWCVWDLISIHAPRVGSDHILHLLDHKPPNFNPRSPCGERLIETKSDGFLPSISIHAPRVGSDPGKNGIKKALNYFNPRSPCGERPL